MGVTGRGWVYLTAHARTRTLSLTHGLKESSEYFMSGCLLHNIPKLNVEETINLHQTAGRERARRTQIDGKLGEERRPK